MIFLPKSMWENSSSYPNRRLIRTKQNLVLWQQNIDNPKILLRFNSELNLNNCLIFKTLG